MAIFYLRIKWIRGGSIQGITQDTLMKNCMLELQHIQ